MCGVLDLMTDGTRWLKGTFTTIHSQSREERLSDGQYCTYTVNEAATQAALFTSVSKIHYKKRKLGVAVHTSNPSALEAETKISVSLRPTWDTE